MERYTMPPNKDDYELRVRLGLERANAILRDKGVQLLQLKPYDEVNHVRTAYRGNSTSKEARDVIFETLRQLGSVVPRKTLSDTLKKKGFSETSTGPICQGLQKQGLITSPRRGFWRIKPGIRRKRA